MRNALILICLILAILPASALAEDLVNDNAYIIENEAGVETVSDVFLERKNTVIFLETWEDSEVDGDPLVFARERYDDLELGITYNLGYNLLILFVLNTGTEGTWENEAKDHDLIIVYDKNTELPVSAIDRVVDDAVELYDKYQSESLFDPQIDYDSWFISIIHDLEGVINEYQVVSDDDDQGSYTSGGSLAGSVLEFNADESIYKPPTSSDQRVKSLNKALNPYNDGIVTYYDPLVCQLTKTSADHVEFDITEEDGGYVMSEEVDCNGGVCTLHISPGELPRGKRYICTASLGSDYSSAELVVAQNVYIFYPLGQNGIGEARGSYKAFYEISEINSEPSYYVKPIYLNEKVPMNGFSYGNQASLEAAAARAMNIYKGDFKHDMFIAVKSNAPNAGLTGFGSHAVLIRAKGYAFDLAHELGHNIGYLCDEYNWDLWKWEDGILKNGCPNPFPESCKYYTPKNPNQVVTCRGMPYENEDAELADIDLALITTKERAKYYSVMGDNGPNMIYPDDPYDPKKVKCPLRNC